MRLVARLQGLATVWFLRCTESLCTTRDRVYSVCHVESYDVQKKFSVKRMHVRQRI